MIKNVVEIENRDYWFKIVEMLQQNWALIDSTNESAGCIIFFIHDGSGIFDQLKFSTKQEAIESLIRNGFSQYSEDSHAQKFIAPPQPPFYEAEHPNGPIYSSGRFWK